MIDYTVTLDGLDKLTRQLEAAGKGTYIRDGLEVVGIDLSGKLKIYPPKPASSKYNRTMQLRNAWTYQVSRDGLVLRVGNNRPYAPYVQSREFQSRVHKWNGWSTAEGTLQLNRERITGILKQFFEKALNG